MSDSAFCSYPKIGEKELERHLDHKSIQDVQSNNTLSVCLFSRSGSKHAFIALPMIVLRLNYLGQMGVQTMR